MATIASIFPTLVDVTKRLDPRGGVLQVAEVLSQVNPMLDDIAFVEANQVTSHLLGLRTALPTPKWRRLNQGIDGSVTKTDTVEETIGMLEDFSKLDVDLANLNGNSAAFRFSEDRGFIQSFNNTVANALFYESQANAPERFTGVTPRLNSTTASDSAGIHTPGFANQLVIGDSGAVGNDQTSIWLMGWGPESIFGIFPKGSVAGLTTEDLGRQLVLDGNNKQFLAYVTRFQWKLGLAVKDYRYISRVCNVDTTNWKENFSTGADLAMRMQDAIARIYSPEGVKLAWYMNRQTFAMFNKQLVNRQANWLEFVVINNRRVASFMGYPIRITDSITSTEAPVV